MQNESLFKRPLVIASIIVGIALIISTIIGMMTFYRVRLFENGLSVTGSAKTSVKADSVKWTSSFSRTTGEEGLQNGYAQMKKDLASVQSFLSRKGVKQEEITVSPVFADQVYNYNYPTGPRQYTLRQTVTVQSKNIALIGDIAKNNNEVVSNGVIFSPQPPEYYYSDLASLRVSLLSDAIKDAKARAQQIAQSSGRTVGTLKSASSGVVQVLAPNSVEVSDYGQYDTSSVDKDVMVTVKATFVVN